MFRSGDKPEETTLVVEKRNLADPLNVDARFTEVEGHALFEGDIVLGSVEEARGAAEDASRGIVILGKQFRWPKPSTQ